MSSLSRMFMFSLAAGIMISLNSWENKYVSLSSLRAVQILSFPTLVKKFESSLTIWRKIWDTRYLSQEESSRDEYNFWALIVIGFFAWISCVNHFSAICEELFLFSSWSLPRFNPKPIKCNPYDLDFVDFRLFQCSFGREKVCLHST